MRMPGGRCLRRATLLLLLPITPAMRIATHAERRVLGGVLRDALEAQERVQIALQEQLSRPLVPPSSDSGEKAAKLYEKALRRAQIVPSRLREVQEQTFALSQLQDRLTNANTDDVADEVRMEMLELGLESQIASFDLEADMRSQWGRPEGFDGVVLQSPREIPILVSPRSYSDEHLRQIARGTDLWFTVREGRGSRVLLRTSMCRHLKKSPRECMETAADLAAYFSVGGKQSDTVEVMYTDSRNVAKRGGRVGQMKEKKKLGIIHASPWRVADMAKEAQEEQGWV